MGAAVKAAKAVFDKLTEKQQYILDDRGYANKLAAALANLGVQVQSLKIKASSKAYKGKIVVKWKVTGTAAAADGYQVYKSTKANSGYKKMGTTKKVTMTNKKGIKKGKRFFYKVRAYVVIDGNTYYSDWSNKANRIAK